MNITWNFPLFLSFWIFGILVLFLWLKNRNSATEFRDVLPSLLLGSVVGLIAAYAGDSARLNHWVLWIAYAAGGFYLTYRLLNKQYTTKSLMWLAPLSMMFQGCGKFSDGTSIWQGGLWIIPTITFLAGCIFMYFGYRASKSGSYYYKKDNLGVNRQYESDQDVPIYKTGQFVFAVIFWLATIGIIIWQNLEK